MQSFNLFPWRSEEFQWNYDEVAWKSELLFELYNYLNFNLMVSQQISEAFQWISE